MSDVGQIVGVRYRVAFTNANQTPDEACRGIYVSTAGALVCQLENESADATFSGLLAGTVYPFRVKKITGSGTTAAGFLLY